MQSCQWRCKGDTGSAQLLSVLTSSIISQCGCMKSVSEIRAQDAPLWHPVHLKTHRVAKCPFRERSLQHREHTLAFQREKIIYIYINIYCVCQAVTLAAAANRTVGGCLLVDWLVWAACDWIGYITAWGARLERRAPPHLISTKKTPLNLVNGKQGSVGKLRIDL